MYTRLKVRTSERACFVDVTPQIRELVAASGVGSGTCQVFVPHTTASVSVNEGSDPHVVRDLLAHLDKLVPWGAAYQHREGNSAAHIKAALIGNSATVFVEDRDLALGTWQAIFLCEFDGPREREVWVRIED
jgi:secondary thiamine-phosphate synthase enzyme